MNFPALFQLGSSQLWFHDSRYESSSYALDSYLSRGWACLNCVDYKASLMVVSQLERILR